MDRETGRDTQEFDRDTQEFDVVPGRDPAIPERGLPELARPVMASLSADPRVPIWIRRAVLTLLAGVAVAIWQNWRWGVTAAAVVAIADTIYQSKATSPVPADVLATSAQRRTRRRLLLLRAFGYVALNCRSVPGTDSVIDHLVIGPAGVFAVDSERWDRRLPVRTTAGTPGAAGVLYHGPFNQSARLAHARWEAAQAASLVGAELGRQISVSAAMVVYGPMIPWGVATLREVDVFGGRRVRKFFRRQNRVTRGRHLDADEIEEIYAAADAALPPAR